MQGELLLPSATRSPSKSAQETQQGTPELQYELLEAYQPYPSLHIEGKHDEEPEAEVASYHEGLSFRVLAHEAQACVEEVLNFPASQDVQLDAPA